MKRNGFDALDKFVSIYFVILILFIYTTIASLRHVLQLVPMT